MNLTFYKYQGTGNDFILIDNRNRDFPKEDQKMIQKLCHRNFGIGADGLILLEEDAATDFRMVYFNADGSESTMCGNGGRCIVAFAKKLGLIKKTTSFMAIDGLHNAAISKDIVSLQMMNVNDVKVHSDFIFTDTGSPHHVQLVEDLTDFSVETQGRKIRNEIYGTAGSNVNFVQQINKNTFKVRTYERGVENETLACGTGVTAVAIAMHKIGKTIENIITLPVQGGSLEVSFQENQGNYNRVFLKGLATFVFKGTITQ